MDLTIKFANVKAMEMFVSWLSSMGEQNYRDWMEAAESRETGPCTVLQFCYTPEGVDATVCGRLNKAEPLPGPQCTNCGNHNTYFSVGCVDWWDCRDCGHGDEIKQQP